VRNGIVRVQPSQPRVHLPHCHQPRRRQLAERFLLQAGWPCLFTKGASWVPSEGSRAGMRPFMPTNICECSLLPVCRGVSTLRPQLGGRPARSAVARSHSGPGATASRSGMPEGSSAPATASKAQHPLSDTWYAKQSPCKKADALHELADRGWAGPGRSCMLRTVSVFDRHGCVTTGTQPKQ